MTTLTISEARASLDKLLDEAVSLHQPIQITGKRTNAVLIAEEDWRAMQETLYLLSIPEMRESIQEGLKIPVGTQILVGVKTLYKNEQEEIKNRQIKLLDKGFYLGKKLYSRREELYVR